MSAPPSSAPPGFQGAAVARPEGEGASVATSRTRWLTVLWALSPLAFGLPAGPGFAWAAWRLRSRALAIEASVYGAVTVLWIAMANQKGAASNVGAVLAIALAVVACVRAFVVRERLLGEASLRPEAGAPPPAAGAEVDAAWAPVFPAQTLREEGHGWASGVACDGHDRHELSMSMRQAAATGLTGAALITADLLLHIYGRGLGAGIGLLLVPVVAVLFARWVDGPVPYYRSWGQLHELPLKRVTAVTAARPSGGRQALLLSAPGVAKPLRVTLQSRGYEMSTAARDHLRGWLSAPHVQWAPEAAALFDDDARRTSRAPGQRRVLALALVALALTVVGFGVSLVFHSPDLAIPGAPGYSTFTGPHGKPLAVGRPWGEPCQPIRFTVEERVPDWVYAQVAAVVSEARRDGIDVTLETRQFLWFPGSLYYLGAQSPASTVRVAIFAQDQAPPQLANGQPEHIDLGWDARLDSDGHHEDLTLAQGILWMQALNESPHAVRRSIRQLVAMTQGVIHTTRQDSGIAEGTNIDHFTPADVSAMKRMSGCSQS
jgi:hypothetical protein